MGIRRAGRIIALQSLYQIDIAEKPMAEINEFIDTYSTQNLGQEEKFLDKSKDFAKELIQTVISNLAALDEIIPKYLKNWKYDRILSIDRNILRLGAAELFYRVDIPYKVTINGVLDNMVKNEKDNFEILRNKLSNIAPHQAAE
jgi:N utilization substance protein B